MSKEATPRRWYVAEPGMIVDKSINKGTIACLAPSEFPESMKHWPVRARLIVKAVNNHDAVVECLEEITLGSGPFSTDPLTHAANTIEAMKGLARDLLAKIKGE